MHYFWREPRPRHRRGAGRAPPGIPFDREDIQKELDRRRPGQSKVVTSAGKRMRLKCFPGVRRQTTGAPLAMIIYNEDQRSKNYDDPERLVPPGAWRFYLYKSTGSGITAGRPAVRAGNGLSRGCRRFARTVLDRMGVRIVAHAIEIAGIRANR